MNTTESSHHRSTRSQGLSQNARIEDFVAHFVVTLNRNRAILDEVGDEVLDYRACPCGELYRKLYRELSSKCPIFGKVHGKAIHSAAPIVGRFNNRFGRARRSVARRYFETYIPWVVQSSF